jgi:hypothetical protein
VHRMVFNGTPSKILEYFNRYNLKEIGFSKGKEEDSFENMIKNILTIPKDFRKNITKHCENIYDEFWRDYNAHFSNLFVFAGLLDLDESLVRDIASRLANYLENEKFIHFNSLKWVTFFISRKHKLFDSALKLRLFRLTFLNSKYHSEEWFEILDELSTSDNPLDFSNLDISALRKIVTGKCKTCGVAHSETMLMQAWLALPFAVEKEKLVKVMRKHLDSDFDSELFYLAVIRGAIPCEESYLNKFIEIATPRKDRVVFKTEFGGVPDKHHYDLDRLLNLLFKENIDLKETRFDQFKNVHPYYDWLLDMESFDYSKFDCRWLTEYGTAYYYKEFRKHPVIKAKLTAYLNKNADQELCRVFFNLYKDWETPLN